MDTDGSQGTLSAVRIADELKDFVRPISSFRTHDRNPRQGDLTTIKESLATFGQVRPIVVQQDGQIVAGNHTWLAARELGWSKIAAVTFTGSDEEAMKFLLMDNRSHEKGHTDQEALASILADMMAAGQLEGTGYTADDVDDLLASMDAVIEVETDDFEGDFAAAPEEIQERYNPANHQPMRPFLLSFPEAEAQPFADRVQWLVKHWGVKQPREAIAEAVRRVYAIEQHTADPTDPETEVAESKLDTPYDWYQDDPE